MKTAIRILAAGLVASGVSLASHASTALDANQLDAVQAGTRGFSLADAAILINARLGATRGLPNGAGGYSGTGSQRPAFPFKTPPLQRPSDEAVRIGESAAAPASAAARNAQPTAPSAAAPLAATAPDSSAMRSTAVGGPVSASSRATSTLN